MSNEWNLPNIPHKGWVLEDVIDIREDGKTPDETDYETCMMCNNERIRYVHILSHQEVEEKYKVGCVCAEKLTNDYVNPKRLEKLLKLKSSRRANWLKKQWGVTEKQNLTVVYQGFRIIIFTDKKTKKFKCKIGENWGVKEFDTLEMIKIAIFDGIEYLKGKGEC
jgi:hypothetical protein